MKQWSISMTKWDNDDWEDGDEWKQPTRDREPEETDLGKLLSKYLNVPITDRSGNPVTSDEAMSLWLLPGYKRVADDQVEDYWVSTVWLGMPHVGGMYETMVFYEDSGHEIWRWKTEEEAQEGHRKIVAFLKAGGHPEDFER